MKILLFSSLILIGMCNSFTLKAQKLPSKQSTSITLPPGFKIDGLANEWDNKFQAHNKSTEVNYTVANNGRFLYLAVQATDPLIIKKIIGGGITFNINANGKRADNASFSVTYPMIVSRLQLSIFTNLNDFAIYTNPKSKDSVINIVNNKITTVAKEIKVKGFKTIADTLIAVYNDTGIKSSAQINSSGALTCEFLVPIELLGITLNSPKLIAYNVMVNGTTSIISVKHPGGVTVTGVPHSLSTNPASTNIGQYPTDFWGSYLLR